jgi:hypothetical protein
MRIILAIVLALPLAGCLGPMSAEQIAAKKAEWATKDDETCRSYGAKPGTDIYIQCRMTQQQSRDAADNAAAAAPVVVNNSTAVPASDAPRLRNCYPVSMAGGVRTVCN